MNNDEDLYSPGLQNTISIAGLIAKENKHSQILPAHFLSGLLHKQSGIKEILFQNDIDVFYLEEWADVKMEDYPRITSPIDMPPISIEVATIIDEALNIAGTNDISQLQPLPALASLATPGVGFSFDELKTFPVKPEQILQLMEQSSHNKPKYGTIHQNQPDYLKDLILQQKKTINLVERDQELLKLTEIIGRQNKPHVIITGENGVGKTVLIQGIATLLEQKKTSAIFHNTQLYELNTNELLAGIAHKGELEERLRKAFLFLEKLDRPILFIDDIQILLDDPLNGKSIYYFLKNQLSKDICILICTTSNESYRKLLEKENPLKGFFERFNLEEPDNERAVRMISANKENLQKHHLVKIGKQDIIEAVKLSKRYLTESHLPESAIYLIDSTMSSIRTQLDTIPLELDLYEQRIQDPTENKNLLFENLKRIQKYSGLETDKKQDINDSDKILLELKTYIEHRENKISALDLAGSVGRIKNIPVGKIVSKERERLLHMEEALQKLVIGQNIAVKTISEAILESRSGLNKPGLPIGSFFFLGPTGTGKTELAKQLAQYLFQSKEALIRFDMSEFKEEHSAALLYGAPPGYVGYEEGGMLVNKIRQNPYSVVLFDEIEKAHASVFDIFLQILDEGKLHDRLGKTGDFSNAVILFTSNIGSNSIVNQFNNNQTLPDQTTLMEAMAMHFRPEFLGRLTGLVPFSPISETMIDKIFDIQVRELEELLVQQGIQLEITGPAKQALAKEGYNPQYGARPLRGIIRSRLRTPLSRMIIGEKLRKDNLVKISYTDEKGVEIQIKKLEVGSKELEVGS